MTQTRLFFQAEGALARQLFAAIEQEFEDDGYPVAILEVDEVRDRHEISVYSNAPQSDAHRIRNLSEHAQALEIELEALPDIDWVARSLEGLGPVRAGRYLVHGSHDRECRRSGDIAIEIDAGQAFGTGHHGTTAGCLAMIGEVVRRERPGNALDLGTGSAVLAIALAKTAPMRVLATDIDPIATRVAQSNIRLNGVARPVIGKTADGFGNRAIANAAPFDLIVANVLAGPLMRLATAMARHIAPGGSVILSGILVRQRRRVIAAYVNQRFRHVRTLTHGDWVTLHLKR